MDSLRYWVLEMHVDGFRFDLASALARELYEVDRLGGVLRHHPPGPGALAGEADRRAVGPRRGRLSGRQLPGAVDGVERQVPRHRPPLLARRRRHGVGARDAARRQQRPVRAAAGGSRTRASTSSPRTTASRSHDLVSYNEKHNEANGEDNRDGENNNLSWNCGVEGPDRRPGDPRAARAAEAQLPGDAAAVAGRADDQPRRRDRPHAARQQQRLLPGQRADAGSTGTSTDEQQALLEFIAQLMHFRLDAAGAAAPQVLPGPQHPRAASRTSPGSRPTAAR